MVTKKLGTFALTSLVVLALGAACSGDDDDSSADTGGATNNGGKGGSSAGTSSKAGSAGKGQGGSAGSSGSGSAGKSTAGTGANDSVGGEGGSDAVNGGAGGASGASGAMTENGGQAGADPVGGSGEGGAGGAGETWSACETVRSELVGPIASVSTGTVEVTSGAAALVTVVVDASAGGYGAAATNPYIYFNLAGKAAVALGDPAADTSLAWDLAFKRDNIRSNGGDSGAGAAQVAALDGADFATVTAAAADTADFGVDEFIDHGSCESILDAVGKPLTRFDGWYEYDEATNGLTPADKVYLIRAANGTSLYKLQITGYYVDVSDGAGGTVKKSAVYSFTYQAL